MEQRQRQDRDLDRRVRTQGRSRRLVLSLLAVITLTTASCGTRLSDEERALYIGSGGGDATNSELDTAIVPSDSNASPGATATEGSSERRAGTRSVGSPTSATPGASPGAPAPDDSGDAGADTGGAAETACAAPSDEKGVTDSTITIGNVSQLSGPIPGFAQKAVNGAQAYVAYVNATGGVCGRQLELEVADDGFDASRNASETARLAPNVLAFGASFSVSDSGTASALSGTNILDVGLATSPARQEMENNFTHLPSQQLDDPPVAAPEWKYATSKGATKAIIVHAAAAAARNRALVDQKNMKAAGLDVELLQVSNTQFSFAGPARAVRDSGAQILLFISEMNASVQMATELRELGTTLPFEWYRIAYGQEFLDRAGDLAEGVMAFLEFVPFEEAGSNPEMALYQQWLQRVAPNSAPSFDSVNSWIIMKLLVQAIRGVDGPITRDGLLASMKTITSYDAGGLIHEMNPAAKQTGGCKMVVRVKGGRWVREAPDSGFLC